MKIRYHIAALTLAICSTASAQIELGYGSEPDSGWGEANSVITPYVSFSDTYTNLYAGNAITSVSIAVMEEATNVYVYIKNRPDDQKYIYRQKAEKLMPGWNEIKLDEPFELTGGAPLAIGYKASFANAKGVAYGNEKNTDADYIYYNSQNRWATTGGSICIKATVDGDHLPTDQLMLFPIKTTVMDKNVMVEGKLWNAGNNDLENCTIGVKLDGEIIDTMESLEGAVLKKGERDSYYVDIDCEDYGTHTITIETLELNGKPVEESAINTVSTTVTLKPTTYLFSRRIVCEEYTGTWCGFCPRGIVGLEMMKEKYGEHFIPIAVHGSDPMQIEDGAESYAPFIDMVAGAPYCKVNRLYGGDPYYDIQSLFDMASNTRLDLAVDLECNWNSDKTAIEATTIYLSGEGIENAHYNIAYTVTESGITGYAQTNYFAGGKNGELAGWEDKTDPTLDVVYNDVARAIIGGYYGMECRYETMEPMTTYNHNISIPLPSNVTNPDNVKVIAQIIDVATGRIVNAAQAVPGGMGAKAIEATEAAAISAKEGTLTVRCQGLDGCTVRVYSIDGRLILTSPCHDGDSFQLPTGIYIAELCDATGTLQRKKIRL